MSFRFSGHETFPCRYAWLPKSYQMLCADPRAWSDENEAMMQLGVGKNMARAARFWVVAMGIAQPLADRRGYGITPFGHALLAPNGFDPFLENTRTLWLLHWKLASPVAEPMFAWHFLLNQWPQPEFSRSQVLRSFIKESKSEGRELSAVTLEQHFDIFLHTYVPTRGHKGVILEDNLDCPLTEIRLLQKVSEREEEGRKESIYSFRREDKPEISGALLAYCLANFWSLHHASEATLGFREIAVAPGSVGQIFKLPEFALRDRLLALHHESKGLLEFQESAALPRVIRHYEHHDESIEAELLSNVYDRDAHDYHATQPDVIAEQMQLC